MRQPKILVWNDNLIRAKSDYLVEPARISPAVPKDSLTSYARALRAVGTSATALEVARARTLADARHARGLLTGTLRNARLRLTSALELARRVDEELRVSDTDSELEE